MQRKTQVECIPFIRAMARLDSASNDGAADGIGFHGKFIVPSLEIGEVAAPKAQGVGY
jgi:hypothetical protein